MGTNKETYYIGSTLINVGVLGASCFPVLVKPSSDQIDGYLKYRSGGSLEIMPAYASGATAGGIGYLMGTTEVYQLNGPAAFYLGATNATCIVQLAINFTAGATLS